MAYIGCSECGYEHVVDTDTACPKCGYNLARENAAMIKELKKNRDQEILYKAGMIIWTLVWAGVCIWSLIGSKPHRILMVISILLCAFGLVALFMTRGSALYLVYNYKIAARDINEYKTMRKAEQDAKIKEFMDRAEASKRKRELGESEQEEND